MRKHFRLPSADVAGSTPPDRAHSITIPLTLAGGTPMHVLTSMDIRQLSTEGLSTEAITHLLVPQEVAEMASTSTPMVT